MGDKKEFLINFSFDVASFIAGFIVACALLEVAPYWCLALVPVLLFWKRKEINVKKEIEY